MSEEKWHPVPEEVSDLFDDKWVSEQCRDYCIKSMFRAKRAIYYGRLAKKAERKAWELVYELYPDMRGESLTFEFGKGVRINAKADG